MAATTTVWIWEGKTKAGEILDAPSKGFGAAEQAGRLGSFQRIRDESHRFARAYHHQLREKRFAPGR